MTRTLPRIEKVLYTARTHTVGGRNGGSSRASDGRLDIKLTEPGRSGDGTNPEQLFAAGWSACYLSAIWILAEKMKVTLPPDSAVDAEVDLGAGAGEYFIRARLNVSLPGIDPDTARKLVDEAHRICPYSKATHGNIDVETNVVQTAAAAPVA